MNGHINAFDKLIENIKNEKQWLEHEATPIMNDEASNALDFMNDVPDYKPEEPARKYFRPVPAMYRLDRKEIDAKFKLQQTQKKLDEQEEDKRKFDKRINQLKKAHARDIMIVIITLCVLAIFIILYNVNTRLNKHDIQIKKLSEQQGNIIIRDSIYTNELENNINNIMTPVENPDKKPWCEGKRQEPQNGTKKNIMIKHPKKIIRKSPYNCNDINDIVLKVECQYTGRVGGKQIAENHLAELVNTYHGKFNMSKEDFTNLLLSILINETGGQDRFVPISKTSKYLAVGDSGNGCHAWQIDRRFHNMCYAMTFNESGKYAINEVLYPFYKRALASKIESPHIAALRGYNGGNYGLISDLNTTRRYGGRAMKNIRILEKNV